MRLTALVLFTLFSVSSSIRSFGEEIQKIVLPNARELAVKLKNPKELDRKCPIAILDRCFFPMEMFQPLVIRKTGAWVDERWRSVLQSRNQYVELQAYPNFEIRSLAFDGASRILAETVFTYGDESQTNLIYASISMAGGSGRPVVEVIGYSDLDDKAEESRIKTRTVEAIMNAYMVRPVPQAGRTE